MYQSFSPINPSALQADLNEAHPVYMENIFAYVNSDQDEDMFSKASSFFGKDISRYDASRPTHISLGRAICSHAGFNDLPVSFCRANNITPPPNCLADHDFYEHIGKHYASQARELYSQNKAKAQALKSKQINTLKKAIPSFSKLIADGTPPSPKDWEALTDAQLSESFHESVSRVQNAVNFFKKHYAADDADIHNEVARLKKEWQNKAITGTTDRPLSDAEYFQQAAANINRGFLPSREHINTFLSFLADDKGNISETDISLAAGVLQELAEDSQPIRSAFARNLSFGISDFIKNSDDALRRSPILRALSGAATSAYYYLTDSNKTPSFFTPIASKARHLFSSIHNSSLSPSDKASWVDGAVTAAGSVFGKEIIPTTAQAVAARFGGIPASLAAGAVSRFPATYSTNLDKAYAEGQRYAEEYAAIASVPEVSLESLFGAAAGSPVGKKLLQAATEKAVSLPVISRAAAAIQANALLRWAGASSIDTVGELFIEDPSINAAQSAIFNSINAAVGKDVFNAPEFAPIKTITDNCSDSRQMAAVASYCFTLGIFGAGANPSKARAYASNVNNLLASGYSHGKAVQLAQKAEHVAQEVADIKANKSLSLNQKFEEIEKLDTDFAILQQEEFKKDVLDADFNTLKKRFHAEGKKFMDKAEALLLVESGAAEDVLKQHNIIRHQTSPDGSRLLTFTSFHTSPEGVTSLKEESLSLSPSQFTNWVAMQANNNRHAAFTDYQNALLGNAHARKSASADSVKHDIINLRDLSNYAEAYAAISRSGSLNYHTISLLAQAVKNHRDSLVANGLTLEQANNTPDSETGVSLINLINLPQAFAARVNDATATTEGKAAKIKNIQTSASAALRLPSAKSLGDSVILYLGGDINLNEVSEELVESDLISAIQSGKLSLEHAKQNLIHIQNELRNFDPSLSILPNKSPENISFQNVVEAFSTLQQVDFLYNSDRFRLSPAAKNILQYVLRQSDIARGLRILGDAWASFSNSDSGKQFLESSGKTLSDLLHDAGLAQSQTYANLRTQEEDRIATAAARGFSLDFSDQQAEVDEKAAAIDAATSNANPADDLPRTQIPAEESVTGSPLPVDPLETADNNPSTGEYKPSPLAETTTDKDFISPVEKNPFGIRTGMMPPANLTPHPALTPRHSTPVSAPYNPNAKPILALRMPDGQHLIVSGRTRHQIALADPSVKAVKTTLINYDPAIHTDDWVLMTNAGEHILSRTATTQDFRTYFTLNPITHAQAIEQGLVPIDPATSQPTAAYIKGRQEAEHTLAAKAEADAAAAKAKAEKSLPGQTKWTTPSPKAKPLSDSQTKQTLISVAGKTASTDGLRPVLSLVTIQRKKGTEYTVSNDITFSLRSRPSLSHTTIMNARERLLHQVSRFITHETNRTARIIGTNTEARRAGIHFAQAKAINNAIQTFILDKELLPPKSPEYQHLKNLRHIVDTYVNIAQKGKLPARRNTKDGHKTNKALAREWIQNNLPQETLEKELIAATANLGAESVINQMMEQMTNILNTHLRNSIIKRISDNLDSLQPKFKSSKKPQLNLFSADTQRNIDSARAYINLSPEQRATLEDQFTIAPEQITQLNTLIESKTPRETILKSIPDGVVKSAYSFLISRGTIPSILDIQDEVDSQENIFQTFAYLKSGTYIDALNAALQLQELITTSRFAWQQKQEERKALIRNFISEAISAVKPGEATPAIRAISNTSVLTSIGDTFLSPLMSASQLFYSLSSTPGFESLATQTVKDITNAHIAISLREQEQDDALVAAYINCIKSPGNLPKDPAALKKLIKKTAASDFNNFIQDLQSEEKGITLTLTPQLTQTESSVYPENTDLSYSVTLTKAEALYLLLISEQKEYTRNFEQSGYTQEILDKILQHIGQPLLDFGHAMRTMLLESGVSQVYAERTGHNMPDNPYYFPAHIDYTSGINAKQTPDASTPQPTSSDSFLKRRTPNLGAVKPLNAISVFRANMASRNNYIHLNPIITTWQSLLASPQFSHRLAATIGESRMNLLKTALNILNNAAWGDSILTDTYHKTLHRIQSAHASSVLALNPTTLLRQLSALNNAALYNNTGKLNYILAAAQTFSGTGAITAAQSLRLPALKSRWQNNNAYQQLLLEGRNATWSRLNWLARKGMETIGAVDILANTFAAATAYNATVIHLNNLNKKSTSPLTQDQIKQQAEQTAATMLELCAQPLRQSQKSLLLAASANAAYKAIGYMNTENFNKLGFARAQGIKTASETGSKTKGILASQLALASVGIPAALITLLIDCIQADIPDDETDKWAWLASNAFQGTTGLSILAQMPILGETIQRTITAWTTGSSTFSHIAPDVSKISAHYKQLFTLLTESNSWSNSELMEAINKCTRDAAQLSALTSTLIPRGTFTSRILTHTSALLASAAAATNTLRLPAGILNHTNPIHTPRRQSLIERTATNLFNTITGQEKQYEKRKKRAARTRAREKKKIKNQRARAARNKQNP